MALLEKRAVWMEGRVRARPVAGGEEGAVRSVGRLHFLAEA